MRIPLTKESVATTTIAFANHILVDGQYLEQRIPISTEPKFTFDLDGMHIRKPDVLSLLNFITQQAKGRLNTFRYQHPYFNTCTAYRAFQDKSNLTYQRGVLVPIKDSDINYQCAIEFGLISSSIFLPEQIPFQDSTIPTTITYKTITKLENNIKIYSAQGDLIAANTYQVDLDTGIIVFSNPQTTNLYWGGGFDLEVRFDSDDISVELVVQNVSSVYHSLSCPDLYKLSSVKLVEVCTTKITPPNKPNLNPFLPQSDTVLDIGILPIVNTAALFQTKIESFDRGFEIRSARSLGNRYSGSYNACKLVCNQANHLFTFFTTCKGNLLKFKLLDPVSDSLKLVRFKEESLQLTLINRRRDNPLFNLESIAFQSAVFN